MSKLPEIQTYYLKFRLSGFCRHTLMTSKEIQLKTSTQKHSIIEDIEGVLVETEMALNRIFQKNQDSGLDSNLLRRLIYTHLSRSQDSLIVLSKIIEAHQKGILDNVLIASLGVTS